MNSHHLNQQSVLITGASGGIGAAIAEKMAAAGAMVGIHYHRSEEQARQLLERLPGTGHRLLQADLSLPKGASLLFQSFIDHFGKIDGLVNNAGLVQAHHPLERDAAYWDATWQKILQINLHAPAQLSRRALPYMKERGNGWIINIGSRGAYRGEPNMPAYAASKAGLHALGQSLAKALAPDIAVYALAPGFVDTKMATEALSAAELAETKANLPMGRLIKPSEIAETALFLSRPEARYLTGSVIDINGASHLR